MVKKLYIILGIILSLVAVALLFAGAINFRFMTLGAELVKHSFDFTIEDEVRTADIELGKRIYAIRNNCIDCHGPDLSGQKIMDNPAMGTIYGANLTPYSLKKWTDREIALAIRYGIHKSGSSLKFMPSFDYTELSKGDIAALIAYLRSVEDVDKDSHGNSFGPIARMLSVFGKMPIVFPAHYIDQKTGFARKPEEGSSKEFGRYLAETCAVCHGQNFAGGPIQGGDPSWPEATDLRLGREESWTEDKFNSMLDTGISPGNGEKLRAPMPVEQLKQLNEYERKALWLFLSELR